MAMLASKSPFPAPMVSNSSNLSASSAQTAIQSSRRVPAMMNANQSFASPTESEFSDVEGPESAKNWDEERVCDWLNSVNCGEYEKLFRKNNINGENLLEMDKAVLQEMGIDKIGDRVRLFLNIKKLRTKAYANQKKRNRDSFAGLDAYTPSSSGSPRPPNGTRAMPTNKRFSRQFESFNPPTAIPENLSKPPSRPSSPLASSEPRGLRQRHGVMSPAEISRREAGQGYFNGMSIPSSAATVSGRRPGTPSGSQTPQTARPMHHIRGNGSIDGSLMAQLPQNQDIIRVISSGGVTKVVRVADCNSCDEVMRVTLRKFGYREDHDRNYCFWVLAGVDADPSLCRRLPENELWRIIKDQKRPERNRLILRKIHQGEPGEAELQRAAGIAMEEAAANHHRALENVDKRSQLKVQKVLGESWNDGLQHPLSPASFVSTSSAVSAGERAANVNNAARDLERPPSVERPRDTARHKAGKNGVLRQFFGQRPPSELITSDLTTYFPDHPREEIDRTARLSLRRSTRLSKVNSRLSVASNLSFASSVADAPPMPTIADTWLSGNSQLAKVRPLDLSRGNSNRYRDSVASSMLERVQEESPTEPNRKSYVSFDSGSDTATNVNVTDPDGNIIQNSYFEDGSTENGSLRDITQALNDDGEDEDEELQSFLAGDSWDDSKWMKGALIGQGSFGSVYLALHAVTGELLAVKQVEAPSPGATSANDARKKSMIDALKREISLLRDLQHPNIVQYLGASSSAEHLNIFLEYVPGGSVQTMLNSYGALREPLIRNFVRQIVTGLAYLHGREIIHRDIKGANILVDNKGGIKISDFGISKKIEASNLLNGAGNNKNRPSLQGSVFWMAPEVVKQTSYTRKADIWSLGCLVVEMMTGTHPFPDCSQLQAIFKIGGAKISPTIPDHASEEAKTFLKTAFEVEHTKRPSAEELLLSPFLNPMT
ncbi:BcSTE11, mitogen-activated protein kinase [Mollisia scopiformis]|uniref:mitogen-activated protein kinase n=1 Tax=Mollisia scopiformis TaxID=149040 RepID=A0A194WUT3_MOLSC|nr:BcSTE11, mitogen-activated protein kinase [Mollisia scopiformis]KUJ11728.1 BcSTE11, mitogen-activated protein kinase [Mollisia scopiformis]